MRDAFAFGSFRLYPGIRVLHKDGVEVPLGSRAFDILTALVEGNGRVLTHRELTTLAWPGLIVEDSNVRVQVANIRRALACDQHKTRYIASVAGRGYCFVAAVVRIEATEPSTPAVPEASSVAAVLHPLRTDQTPQALPSLPMPLKSAVGREDCVTELSQVVLDRRLVTVVGAAGAGKTTLAVLVAHDLLGAFDGAIHFVDLSALECGEMVAEAVAAAVGYHASGADILPGLLEVLSTTRTLIVLDNCEHLIAAVAALCLQIVDGTGSVSFLNTSREAFRVNDEFIYLLRPLASPPNTGRLTAKQALVWPAVQLFMERAREGGARNDLRDEDAPTVAALCRRLDGNPHAIGLVASRVGTYGVQGVADLLANQFALHWQGRRDACPRQQTVETMIDWSHNLLVERDRQVLYRLSVFWGVFTLDAAVAVAADREIDAIQVGEAVSDLVDKSLVAIARVSGALQFRLFETTRAYAASRLARFEKRNEYARRHALYYAGQLRRLKEARVASSIASSEQSGPLDVGNLRAAIDWAFSEQGALPLAVEISCLAAPLFLERGLLMECKRCCERALRLLPEAFRTTKTELELLESAAVTYYSAGDYDGEMTPVVERGLELSRQMGDVRSMFHFLAGLHLAMMANGRFQESRVVSERYASAAATHGGPCEAIIARWMEGSSWHFSGHQAAADESYSAGAGLLAGRPLRPLQYFETKEQVVASLGQARVKWIRGMPLQALQLATSAIAESRRNPDSFYLCATLCFPILLSNGLLDRAQDLIHELESVAVDYKVAVRRQVIFFLNGLLMLQRGHHQVAADQLQQCLALLPPPKMSVVRTDALQALAQAQRECGEGAEALASIEEAIELAEITSGNFNFPDLLRTKAEVILSLPPIEKQQIEDLLSRALASAREQSALSWELRVALLISRVRAGEGKSREAREQLEAVYSRFTEGFETSELKISAEVLRAMG
ncbi:winged helix-turn-helix domain-containing protein [Pseudomonas resinovorans]|uniref:ATP-binding protein n=1 Tax=Metapseudomonas resinovorans TaxID=53412 RepID=UPI00237F7DD3|nr:winged helix-turn-helix domain-containing protein [Pseudomonas resinovorans]MDE3738804.1 winged helix-turn-helix domain-containing protein [Pseudomonas resinovorans]